MLSGHFLFFFLLRVIVFDPTYSNLANPRRTYNIVDGHLNLGNIVFEGFCFDLQGVSAIYSAVG